MLVICEDCAKRYNIDASRIKGRRARFTCSSCGHIIIIDKDDLTRSLLTGKASAAPTFDLLKEMEIPPPGETGGDLPGDSPVQAPGQEQEGQKPDQEAEPVKRRNRGVPVFASFIGIMLVCLVCISLTFGYLYSAHIEKQHLADALKRAPGLRMQVLLESSLIFAAAGACVIFLFCLIARVLQGKLKRQVETANLIGTGEPDVPIDTRGPREIRDLAYALKRISDRLKQGRGGGKPG